MFPRYDGNGWLVDNKGQPPQPTGVLVIRAWFEGPDDGGTLRLRVVSRADVTREKQESHAAQSLGEAMELVHNWLTEFESRRLDEPSRTEER